MAEADVVSLTSRIVAAYVGNNAIGVQGLPELIGSVQHALSQLGQQPDAGAAPERPKPAVPIKRSVSPDAIVCLECGKRQKMLKRHLGSEHGLSPDEYRQRWNLPPEYPMTAPEYAAQRSAFAKSIGLGKARSGRGARSKRAPR